jgi:glycosyltransferase involved in cell wall biosynthesis
MARLGQNRQRRFWPVELDGLTGSHKPQLLRRKNIAKCTFAMRLLFVHDRFGAMAGAEVNLQLTAAALKDRGHVLALLHGRPTGKGESQWRELFHDRFDLTIENTSSVSHRALRAFNPAAVYIHKMSDPLVLETLAKANVPVVRMVHDHDLYCMRSYKYFPLTRKICTHAAGFRCIFPCGAFLMRNRNGAFPLRWVSYRARKKEMALNRRFQKMIVATDYMRQELLRNGFNGRRIEVHSPVPLTDYNATEASFSDRNLIIYSGQIIRGKGVDVLVESLARVRARFECMIFGDGNHREYCEQLTDGLGLNDRVHFKGYVHPAELSAFYADASLAVVSSVWPEPFGAVGLEAMRHGLPVVAFAAGGIGEWLLDGENGFLVPWMDRTQFAARVGQLLTDKTLARRLGWRGKQLASEKFSFDQYISGLEDLFSRTVRNSVEPAAVEIEHG